MSSQLQNYRPVAGDTAWLADLVNAFQAVETVSQVSCDAAIAHAVEAHLSRPSIQVCGRRDETLLAGDLQPRPLSLFDVA